MGTPGPPAIVYMAAQGWSPRTIKANLQAFLVVNQLVILVGYWWAGLLTREVWRLAGLLALPAALGLLGGHAALRPRGRGKVPEGRVRDPARVGRGAAAARLTGRLQLGDVAPDFWAALRRGASVSVPGHPGPDCIA